MITLIDLFKNGFLNKEEDSNLYKEIVRSVENFNKYYLKQRFYSHSPPSFYRKFKRPILILTLISALSSSCGAIYSSISHHFSKPRHQTEIVYSPISDERTVTSPPSSTLPPSYSTNVSEKTDINVPPTIKIAQQFESAKSQEYFTKEETDFRKRIIVGAEKELGKPVRFDWTDEGAPINVCTDIVVRAMQYAGINVPKGVYNENKRACSAIGPWMIRGGCADSSNNVKPGMIVFFSGEDNDTGKYKQWFHSAIVLNVENGAIKTAIMSSGSSGFIPSPNGLEESKVFDVRVKIVDFEKWYNKVQRSHTMKILTILDPYDLTKEDIGTQFVSR